MTLRPALSIPFAVILSLLVISPVFADDISTVLCGNAVPIASEVADAVATLAIIFLGISAMLGKASWTMAACVLVGVGIVGGADSLALYFSVGC